MINGTPKTIDHYKTRQNIFGCIESEQLLRLLRKYKTGQEVFDSAELFNQLLGHAVAGMYSIKDFGLLNFAVGIQLVVDELFKLKYGALS